MAEQFWKLFWTFHRDRLLCLSFKESHCKPGCSQVDVGDVMSDKVTRIKLCEVWRTLRYDNCQQRKWSPKQIGEFIKPKFKILTCVVLLGWLSMHVEGNKSRGIWRREYEQGNMTRGIWAREYDEGNMSGAIWRWNYEQGNLTRGIWRREYGLGKYISLLFTFIKLVKPLTHHANC